MKTIFRNHNILLAAIPILIALPTLNAASFAVSFSLPQSAASGSFLNGLDGFDFTPNVDLIVSALGWYDHGGDGLIHSHPVGIYTTSTQTLAAPAASISGTSNLDITNNFRYEDVVPFVLTAGTTYTLVGYGQGPTFDPYVTNPAGGIIFGPGFDYVRLRTSRASGLEFPTAAGQVGLIQNLYWGPNFRYTAVPEPHVAGIIGVGLLVTMRARRRRIPSQQV